MLFRSGSGAERVVRAGCTDCAVEARDQKSRSPLEITSSVFTGADGRRPMVREDVPPVPLYETSIESSLTADTTSVSSRATVTDARFVAPAIDTTVSARCDEMSVESRVSVSRGAVTLAAPTGAVDHALRTWMSAIQIGRAHV